MRKTSVFAFALFVVSLSSTLWAAPSTITYQGRLYKAGVGAAGTHNFTFTLVSSSGTRTLLCQTPTRPGASPE